MISDKDLELINSRIAQGSQDPTDYDALAQELASRGDHKAAIEMYRTALDLGVDDIQKARILTDLGFALRETAQETELEGIIEEVRALLSGKQETVEVLLVKFSLLTLLAYTVVEPGGSYSQSAVRSALNLFEKLVETDLPDTEKAALYYPAAELYVMNGDFKKAIDLCNKALKSPLGDTMRVVYLLSLAGALELEGQLDEAFDSTRTAVKLAEQEPEKYRFMLPHLYLQLGVIQYSRGQLTEALHSFEHALELVPHDVQVPSFVRDIRVQIGTVAFVLERYQEAVNAYNEALRLYAKDDASHRFALRWLGKSHLELGEVSKAKQCFTMLLKSPYVSDEERTDINAALFLNEAISRYNAGDYESAAKLFEDVLANQPQDNLERVDTLHWLGHSYRGLEKYEAARQCYEQMLQSPNATEDQISWAREALEEISEP